MSRLACCKVAPEMSKKFSFEFLHFRLLPHWLIHKIFWPPVSIFKAKMGAWALFQDSSWFFKFRTLLGLLWPSATGSALSSTRGKDVICPSSLCCPWTTVAQKLLTFVCCYAIPLLTFNTRFQSIHTNRAGYLKGDFRQYIYFMLLLLCVFRLKHGDFHGVCFW